MSRAMPQGAVPAEVHVRTLRTVDALRAHVASVGADLPLDDEVDPAGALAQPMPVGGRA